MSSKRNAEKSIRNNVRRCFKLIKPQYELIFIILMLIFSYIVLHKPTLEKIIIYFISLIFVQVVIWKDEDRKLKINMTKNNIN